MEKGRQRGGRSLKRTVGIRRPRKTLVVFCEGQRTEPEYLEALRRDAAVRGATAVDLRIEGQNNGSMPLMLVEKAVAAKEKAEREEGEIDEFWCLFDVEWPTNHPDLKKAINLANRCGISVAISNPCFEFWLILHFREYSAWLNNDNAARLRRSCDGQKDKGVRSSSYVALRHVAAARAEKLAQWHEKNGTPFPHDNPSSGMYRLIASMEPPVVP